MTYGFIDRFIETALQNPQRIAVEDHSGITTYDLLLRRAAAIGEDLKARSLPRESIIGLCFEKSADYIAALLGVWYAGLAFAPLPPSLPAARRDYIVRDADIRVFLQAADLPAALPAERPLSPAPYDPARLAYVMHTSGSTGTPKGVAVEHRGIYNVISQQIGAFGLDAQSRCLFYLSISFDASLSDICTALLSGAALVIAPEDVLRDGARLLKFFSAQRITHSDLPPSLLRLIDPDDLPATLRTVIIGGEACPPDTVRRWAAKINVINVYGPTETTICTSFCPCDAATWQKPLLGRPFSGVTYRIIDEELYIGGCQLARGYLNLPALDAVKFPVIGGERFYRTGDRVRTLENGDIEFLGRLDRQFKLRGQLVEPDEIEAQLLALGGIRRAAVVKTDNPVRLIAYVTAARDIDEASLRAALSAHLPAWMMPARILRLSALPETATGKTDYAALAALSPPLDAADIAAPQTAEQKKIWALWRGVIGHDRFGIDQSFYSAGGDSLGIIRLTLDAARAGIDARPAETAEGKTIRELAGVPQSGEAFAASAHDLRRRAALDADMSVKIQSATARPYAAADDAAPILLTGGTGCLGARVLAGLLAAETAEIICVVRAENDARAKDRVLSTFDKYGICPPERTLARLRVLAGDVSLPRLGLAAGTYQELADAVGSIYHCAATVNMLADMDTLAPANLDAVRHILDFALTGRRKDIHAASTLSVFVSTDQNTGILREDDRLENVRRVYGGYAQTKFAAECLLLAVPEEACRIWHYRFGLLTGDTRTGAAPDKDFLSLFGRGLAALGVMPDGFDDKLHVDITPVDYAARAMLHLAAKAPAGIYHIAGKEPLSFGRLTAAMARAGYPLARLAPEGWRQMLESRPMDMTESAAALGLCRVLGSEGYARHRIMDLFQASGVVFDTDKADAFLRPAGILCPDASDALLDLYMTHVFPKARRTLKICLFGPESTGKSTLARNLAAHLRVPFCAEYAKEYIETHGRDLTLRDMSAIAAGQRRAEAQAAAEAADSGIVICDTDALTTSVWSRRLFGACDDWIDALAAAGDYDLTLLMDIDAPWVDDVHRYLPEDRAAFLADCEAALARARRPYIKLSGSWAQKFTAACAAIENAKAGAAGHKEYAA